MPGALGIGGLRFGVRCVRPGNVDLIVQPLLVPVAAQQVEGLIDGNPVDPAEELVVRVVFIETFGNLEKNVLGNVAGIVGATQNPVRSVVDRSLVSNHQLGERLAVTTSVPVDERLIDVIVHNYTRPPEKLERAVLRTLPRSRTAGRTPNR